MVSEFIRWLEVNKKRLEGKRVNLEIKRNELPMASATAYLDTESHMANVTVWEMGSLDIHVVSCETAEEVLADRYDFNTSSQMLSVLEKLVNKIISRSIGDG